MLGSAPELYDRIADPAEQRNVASEHPETVHDLRTALDALTGGGAPAPRVDESELDPVTVERLRALGYVE